MNKYQNIHFVAIGGSIMHNLAIDAHQKGIKVSGSDDEIFEPSRSRLDEHGILPAENGWFPEKNIHKGLDAVIVGMHARADNPELQRAKELNINVLSFPQYIYEHCQNKHRVVIGGSHGKTTITAMIMHVLQENQRKFDYVVGAKLEGFDQMIRLSHDAPVIIIEGDEYPSAPFDPTPKFLHYQHHIGVITGIAWDHMNIYKSVEDYFTPFEHFADATPKAGSLILSQDDSMASVIGGKEREDVAQIAYQAHPHKVIDGQTYLLYNDERIPIRIFGEHNMKNISAAKHVCARIGIKEDNFYEAIRSFKGAAKRLEKVAEGHDFTFFKDYAHAPSKLLATTTAVRKQYIERKLVACLELHTYSSLNKDFLPQYRNMFNAADRAIVYYNPEKLKLKQMPALSPDEIAEAFGHDNMKVFDDIEQLQIYLLGINWQNKNLLMMSSGNFDNLDLDAFAQKLNID